MNKNYLFNSVRKLVLPVIILISIILLASAYYICPSYIRDHWAEIRNNYDRDVTAEVQDLFRKYQEETVNAVINIASKEELQACLSDSQSDRVEEIFRILIDKVPVDLSLELYDNRRQLVGWAGARGQLVDTAEIETIRTSFLIKGPIYSYLVASIPVNNGNRDLGHLIGKRLFEVNYPINNRFITNEAFTSTFAMARGVPPEFKFVTEPSDGPREESVMIPLYGLGGNLIGTGMVSSVSPEIYTGRVQATLGNIFALAVILIVIIMGYNGCRWIYHRFSLYFTIFAVTAIIWLVRYLFVWFNIPQSLIDLEIFYPLTYASKFGFGITRSLGDLFLSSIFLVGNLIISVSLINSRRQGDAEKYDTRTIDNPIYGWLLVLLITPLIFISLRSWAAIVRSAFFDSTINYSASSAIQVPVDLLVMLVSLFIIASCFSLLFFVMARIMRNVISNAIFKNRKSSWYYIFMLIFLTGGGLVFEAFQGNRILEPWYYVAVLIILLFLQNWFTGFGKGDKLQPRIRNLFIIMILALILIIPLLKINSDKKDYAAIELLAGEIVRPEDTWLSHLLSQSLEELARPENVDVIKHGNSNDLSTLAYRQWAHSTLSRIGNNCSVTFLGPDGSKISDFTIGLKPAIPENGLNFQITAKQIVGPEEKGLTGYAPRVYTGYRPLYDSDGVRYGSVIVRIAGGKGAIIASSSADIFRSYPRISLGLREFDIVLLEYSANRLISSSSDDIPIGISLPVILRDSIPDTDGIWLYGLIGDKSYKAYYFRGTAPEYNPVWYALGFQKSGWQWELFLHLKFFLFYALVTVIVLCVFLGWYFLRGDRFIFTFKIKLLAAFLFVSIIPMILLAYYNRYYVEESALQSLNINLSKQTALVISEVKRTVSLNSPADLASVDDNDCSMISERLGSGFNLFLGSYIHSTSMPELFTAELMDPWLPADVVLNVLLRGQGFYMHQQKIGTYQYFIGYRPIYTSGGSMAGILSIPSLYSYTEVERSLIHRNVYLFGAFTIVLLVSLIVGILFTNQLYHPLRRLQRATDIIASGKFDIGITKTRSDEFGDLEQSFVNMTRDLQEAQRQLIKAEREAVWKEMAKQVAHEIKNPLTPMKLSIQHAERAYYDRAKNFEEIFKQVMRTLLQQIETLSNIATEFSRMAKMPDRNIIKVDVNEILNESASLYSQYRDIKFTLSLHAESPYIYADREELQRAFVNILRNAVQAMKESGSILIETISDETMVEIRIKDSGPGMPEGVLGRIFEPYFSTKKEGMGLGLTLVKKTIEDLWGTIEIISASGEGTTIHIRLPQTGRH